MVYLSQPRIGYVGCSLILTMRIQPFVFVPIITRNRDESPSVTTFLIATEQHASLSNIFTAAAVNIFYIFDFCFSKLSRPSLSWLWTLYCHYHWVNCDQALFFLSSATVTKRTPDQQVRRIPDLCDKKNPDQIWSVGSPLNQAAGFHLRTFFS